MQDLSFIANYKPSIRCGPSSMVSLHVPPTHNLDNLRQKIDAEYLTAGNIKNVSNRKGTKESLSRIKNYLRRVKTIPSTGMAVFSDYCI